MSGLGLGIGLTYETAIDLDTAVLDATDAFWETLTAGELIPIDHAATAITDNNAAWDLVDTNDFEPEDDTTAAGFWDYSGNDIQPILGI